MPDPLYSSAVVYVAQSNVSWDSHQYVIIKI